MLFSLLGAGGWLLSWHAFFHRFFFSSLCLRFCCLLSMLSSVLCQILQYFLYNYRVTRIILNGSKQMDYERVEEQEKFVIQKFAWKQKYFASLVWVYNSCGERGWIKNEHFCVHFRTLVCCQVEHFSTFSSVHTGPKNVECFMNLHVTLV